MPKGQIENFEFGPGPDGCSWITIDGNRYPIWPDPRAPFQIGDLVYHDTANGTAHIRPSLRRRLGHTLGFLLELARELTRFFEWCLGRRRLGL
jgi:hypothetical protein